MIWFLKVIKVVYLVIIGWSFRGVWVIVCGVYGVYLVRRIVKSRFVWNNSICRFYLNFFG